MKDIIWMGRSHEDVLRFSKPARRSLGYSLDKIQRGSEPSDWKPMASIGQGVKEIRVHVETEYRVIYVAKFKEAAYVLHAFIKKAQQTPQKDLTIAKARYKDMIKLRGK